VVLKARPLGISTEASNARHGHEWQVFGDVWLPDGKYVVPGTDCGFGIFVGLA
jgi:5-methyltetrahydropteroyltriglutamate--homocysteine methyltransferase